jgi:GntR family transcriptional regulator
LYEWLERECGVRITGASEFIEASTVHDEMARELQVPRSSAVLVAKRLSRDSNGLPIEYAVLHFRADRYRFHLEVKR